MKLSATEPDLRTDGVFMMPLGLGLEQQTKARLQLCDR